MKLKVYIVGPYSNADKTIRDQNIEKAKQAARKVWNSGNYAYCPHLNTGRFEDDPECAVNDSHFVEGHLSFMHDCHCLYVLSDYEKSKGSVGEIAAAIERGMPVFYQDKDEFPPSVGQCWHDIDGNVFKIIDFEINHLKNRNDLFVEGIYQDIPGKVFTFVFREFLTFKLVE